MFAACGLAQGVLYILLTSGILQVAWLADCLETTISMHCSIPGHDIYNHPVGSRTWEKEIHILWVDLNETRGQRKLTTANHLVPLLKTRNDGN